MTVENSVSKTPKLVMGAKTYDFNFDVLLEDPTAEEAKRAIKCSISNGTEETELIYGTDYTVTLNSDKKGGVVTVTDTKNSDWHIVIYRQYNMTQGVDLNDYNEFPAETIERALDKLIMLIQELKEIAERSVKVTPANNQTPEELLDEVYSKLDSATEVATNAIAAATLATTAAESATKAVEDAEQQVAEVTKYIDDKKVEIDGIVIDAQNSVDGAIQQAVEDVKQAAVNEAESVIQDAGQTATNIAVDYVNTTVKPELQGISDNAQQYATNAKASQEAAKVSETNAKVSETNAERYAESINPKNLSGLGMPSEKYDVITLGASDTTYTAPANGYYNVVLQVETDQHAFVEMINLTCESFSKNVEKERGTARIEIGCRKGDVIKIQWNKIAQNDINRLRFYYAEGEK